MTTSPLLTGGAGFDFEDSVAAVYLTALLLESGVLGLGQFTASRVALQRPSSGAPLDDGHECKRRGRDRASSS